MLWNTIQFPSSFKNDMGYDFLAVIWNLFSIYAMVLFHVSEDFG